MVRTGLAQCVVVAVVGAGSTLLAVTSPPAAADGHRCAGKAVTIVARPGEVTRGTAGPDVIRGTRGVDDIRAGGGYDRVCALGGEDAVRGGRTLIDCWAVPAETC